MKKLLRAYLIPLFAALLLTNCLGIAQENETRHQDPMPNIRPKVDPHPKAHSDSTANAEPKADDSQKSQNETHRHRRKHKRTRHKKPAKPDTTEPMAATTHPSSGAATEQ